MRIARFSDTTASVLLDAIRGLAAFLVLLEHWRNAFFVDFQSVVRNRALLGSLYVLSGAGHQAVIIFFVLSGFLISGTVLRAVKRHDWSWSRYAVHRLVRLWVVLIPALCLGALWDNLGIDLRQASALYSGANYNHMTPDIAGSLTLVDFFGNAAFLQDIAVPTFGSNGPLWSLANEFWYYALFPLGVCVVACATRARVHSLIYLALFAAIAAGLTKEILLLFPVWLLGGLLHAVPRCKPTTFRVRALASAVYGIFFFGEVILDHRGWFGRGALGDWLLGIATFGFIWVLLGAQHEAKKTMLNHLARQSARFSFTLYAAHMPILIFVVSLLAHDARWIPNSVSALEAVGVLAAVIAYSWLLARVTEFKTDRVRAWIEDKILPPLPGR
jgi:peptidoglycan/LPS O-acetylase OafA/YrhL